MVGLDEESHKGMCRTRGGFDGVGDPVSTTLLIGVIELRSGVPRVSGEIKVGAVDGVFGLASLAALETEAVFDVDDALRIMRELFS